MSRELAIKSLKLSNYAVSHQITWTIAIAAWPQCVVLYRLTYSIDITTVSSAKFNPDKHMTTWYFTWTDSQTERAEGHGYAARTLVQKWFYKSLTKKWNQYTWVGHGSLLTDPSRPDPPQIKKSDPTRPISIAGPRPIHYMIITFASFTRCFKIKHCIHDECITCTENK